jgi:hypothetical protein
VASYPEHEKLTKIKNKSQAVGEFLEWLGGCNVVLAKHTDHGLEIDRRSIVDLLYEYFEIDPDTLEEEKQAMLDDLRGVQHNAN